MSYFLANVSDNDEPPDAKGGAGEEATPGGDLL